MEKTKIFNVIILDKSGSMYGIRNSAIKGVNKTIKNAQSSQKQYKDTQQQYLLLNAFCGHGISTIYNNVKISEAKKMTEREYVPCCSTPLYDAIGITLTKLEERLELIEDYFVNVTIITDGYENASVRFSGNKIRELINRLKEKGWNFIYIGANHDVEKVAKNISIDRFVHFSHDEDGMKKAYNEISAEWNDSAEINYRLRKIEEQQNARLREEERREFIRKELFNRRAKRDFESFKKK